MVRAGESYIQLAHARLLRFLFAFFRERELAITFLERLCGPMFTVISVVQSSKSKILVCFFILLSR